ncbi:MAG TPA: DUF4292 domain-containing protein [Clostridia bacterium]|nr:DUF4292 domain-containing protein [Clostridia bacterium]
MNRFTSRYLLVLVMLPLLLFSSGCLFRSRKVEQRASTAPLLTANQQELVARINAEAAQIRTMNATVDIAASVGGARKGKITDYQEIRGYILAQKPAMLRMIGLFPIVRNRAFDMVSDGQEFKLSVPPKNRFIVGRNDVINPSSTKPLENLRPQHIYDALLLREVDPQNEIAVLEGATEDVIDPKTKKAVQQGTYIINVIRRDGGPAWFLSRKIYFNRVNLTPDRQIVYDKNGNVATIAEYSDFRSYNGVNFPSRIRIVRPQEEYEIGLKMVSLKLNEPLKPEQFNLQQPPGSQLVRLDANGNAQTASGDGK